MARLEDLISDIADQELRASVTAEVRKLKEQTRFGLVYERHIPEHVLIGFAAGLATGDSVRLRKHPADKAVFSVVDVAHKSAVIRDETRSLSVPVEDLLLVKGFGEPVFPTLASLGSLGVGGDKSPHLVIDAENYHALELLTYTHRESVDCIYLDPPYNTGARDWKYNNDYVDTSDAWRHSKWLSFMEKRLALAKQLLKPDGVLIVAIDEFELYHLGMLLEHLFPEYMRYKVSAVTNPKGSTGTRNFGVVDEQLLFCVPDVGRNIICEVPVETPDTEQWEYQHARRRGGATSYRHQRPKQFYPLFIDEDDRRVVRAGPAIPLELAPNFDKVDGLRPIWPIDSHGLDRCWRFSPSSMQREIDAGNVVLGKHNERADTWTINIRRPKRTTRKLKSVWWETSHDAGTHGTELLRAFLGRPGLFPFPKSLYSVRDALAAVVLDRPSAVIVDFFAGSGTTLHATALLNSEDLGFPGRVLGGGQRVPSLTACASRKSLRAGPYSKRTYAVRRSRPRRRLWDHSSASRWSCLRER